MQVAFLQAEQYVGKTFGGYVLERLIGQGQWNAVYQARPLTQQHPVLLTLFFLPTTLSSQARQHFITRLRQEGVQLTRLRHPHILPVLEVNEHAGNPFLVTSFVKGTTLATLLKQEGRFNPSQTLEVLKPLADALDYAHSQDVLHGALSSSHILLDSDQKLRVTSFGFNRLVSAQNITESALPDNHLLSLASTPLPGLDYVAPEVVQGSTFDARADIYALGTLLFELLCGRLPFTGASPLERAQKRVQNSVPRLTTIHKDIPEALDLVVHLAVRRDPLQRVSSAGKVALAFERALAVLASSTPHVTSSAPSVWDRSSTLPPSVDWAIDDEEKPSSWQLLPPTITTGPVPAVNIVKGNTLSVTSSPTQSIPQTPDIAQAPTNSTQVLSSHALFSTSSTQNSSADTSFAQQNHNPAPSQYPPLPQSFTHTNPARTPHPQKRRIALPKDRRKTAVVLATGGLLSLSALGLGALGLSNLLRGQSNTDPNKNNSNQVSTDPTTNTSSTPTKTATKPAKPTPTKASTNQATNPSTVDLIPKSRSAREFVNTIDNQPSLLIRLPDGNFVAFEKRCTHEGNPIYYDDATNQLVCPTHGSRFDPNHRGEALGGLTLEPLIPVPVQVQADGTITVLS